MRTKSCPECNKDIPLLAKRCRYCKAILSGTGPVSTKPPLHSILSSNPPSVTKNPASSPKPKAAKTANKTMMMGKVDLPKADTPTQKTQSPKDAPKAEEKSYRPKQTMAISSVDFSQSKTRPKQKTTAYSTIKDKNTPTKTSPKPERSSPFLKIESKAKSPEDSKKAYKPKQTMAMGSFDLSQLQNELSVTNDKADEHPTPSPDATENTPVDTAPAKKKPFEPKKTMAMGSINIADLKKEFEEKNKVSTDNNKDTWANEQRNQPQTKPIAAKQSAATEQNLQTEPPKKDVKYKPKQTMVMGSLDLNQAKKQFETKNKAADKTERPEEKTETTGPGKTEKSAYRPKQTMMMGSMDLTQAKEAYQSMDSSTEKSELDATPRASIPEPEALFSYEQSQPQKSEAAAIRSKRTLVMGALTQDEMDSAFSSIKQGEDTKAIATGDVQQTNAETPAEAADLDHTGSDVDTTLEIESDQIVEEPSQLHPLADEHADLPPVQILDEVPYIPEEPPAIADTEPAEHPAPVETPEPTPAPARATTATSPNKAPKPDAQTTKKPFPIKLVGGIAVGVMLLIMLLLVIFLWLKPFESAPVPPAEQVTKLEPVQNSAAAIPSEKPTAQEKPKETAAEVVEVAPLKCKPLSDYPPFPWQKQLAEIINNTGKKGLCEIFGMSEKQISAASTTPKLDPTGYDLIPKGSMIEFFPSGTIDRKQRTIEFLFSKNKLYEIRLNYNQLADLNFMECDFPKDQFSSKWKETKVTPAGKKSNIATTRYSDGEVNIVFLETKENITRKKRKSKNKKKTVGATLIFASSPMQKTLTRSLKKQKQAQANLSKGLEIFYSNKPAKAIKSFKKARRIIKDFGETYIWEARLAIHKEDFKGAFTPARKALKTSSDNKIDAQAKAIMAVAHLYLGNKKKAIAFYNKAYALDPANYDYSLAAKELEKGKYKPQRIAVAAALFSCKDKERGKNWTQNGILARGNFTGIKSYKKAIKKAKKNKQFKLEKKRLINQYCPK